MYPLLHCKRTISEVHITYEAFEVNSVLLWRAKIMFGTHRFSVNKLAYKHSVHKVVVQLKTILYSFAVNNFEYVSVTYLVLGSQWQALSGMPTG